MRSWKVLVFVFSFRIQIPVSSDISYPVWIQLKNRNENILKKKKSNNCRIRIHTKNVLDNIKFENKICIRIAANIKDGL